MKKNPWQPLEFEKRISVYSLLQDTDLNFTEISKATGVSVTSISRIYRKEIYQSETKYIKFRKREFNSERPLSEDDIIEICSMLETKKYSQKEIADKFHVTDKMISMIKRKEAHVDILDKYGIDLTGIDSKKANNEINETIKYMLDKGCQKWAIAEVLGLSYKAVDSRIRRMKEKEKQK